MPDTLTTLPAEATVGHNSAAVGEMIEADPALVYRDQDTLAAFFDEIDARIAAHVPDLTTEAGRSAIASMAYKIAKQKTRLDEAGKKLNEDHRAAINTVDAVRRKVRDGLDAMRDKARAPLTEWESAEDARQKRITDTLSRLEYAARPAAGADSAELAKNVRAVEAVSIDEATFQARLAEVTMIRDRVLANLRAAHASAVKGEEAQAELSRIKAEQAEKDRADTEAKAKADQEAAEALRIERERQRRADEVKAAEDRAAEAAKAKAEEAASAAREKERKAAQAKLDAVEAERKAAADALAKKQAEETEAKRKADAVTAERKRREADEDHRKGVIKAAVLAMSEQTGTPVEVCRQIVLAIAAGQVPAIAITF